MQSSLAWEVGFSFLSLFLFSPRVYKIIELADFFSPPCGRSGTHSVNDVDVRFQERPPPIEHEI